MYIRPLIVSQSAGMLAQILEGISLKRVIELADYIIQEAALSRDQKLLFLFALALNYQNDTKSQYRVLDLITKYDQLQKDTPPILLVAGRSQEFNKIVPILLAWAQKKQLFQVLVEKALAGSVAENDPDILKKLVAYNMPITSKQASQNLLEVVKKNKDTALVPFFVKQGADPNFIDNKRTLIMYATENNNTPMVKALLENGADAEKFIDPAVGTALQIAIEKGYAAIDELLRKYGAREK